MVSDYFNYETDSLDHIIPDLEVDSIINSDWGLHTYNNPTYVVHNDVFTDDEICKIIFAGKNSTCNFGTVGTKNGFEIDPNIRKSKVSWLQANPFNSWIYERLTEYVNQSNDGYWQYDLRAIQTLQFSEYDCRYEGQYVSHIDSTFGYNLKTEDRKISFSIQLSDPDDYEGGELLLNHGTDCIVSKTKGSMTLFPSFTVHEVKPVTKGIRYSLVGWVVGEKLK
jgi:PKHD-type hydroxylase